MKWIKINVNDKNTFPNFEEDVLVFGSLGHLPDIHIASLHDTNDPSGYIKYINCFGCVTKSPNKKYPENLGWSFGGHWKDFNSVIYWHKLPKAPEHLPRT